LEVSAFIFFSQEITSQHGLHQFHHPEKTGKKHSKGENCDVRLCTLAMCVERHFSLLRCRHSKARLVF